MVYTAQHPCDKLHVLPLLWLLLHRPGYFHVHTVTHSRARVAPKTFSALPLACVRDFKADNELLLLLQISRRCIRCGATSSSSVLFCMSLCSINPVSISICWHRLRWGWGALLWSLSSLSSFQRIQKSVVCEILHQFLYFVKTHKRVLTFGLCGFPTLHHFVVFQLCTIEKGTAHSKLISMRRQAESKCQVCGQ